MDSLRITGLASGMDTETMIKQMMRVENMRVDKVKQQRQYAEWQRDAYREISNALRGFQDDYFNYLKPSNNFRSPSTFSVYEALSSNTDLLSVKVNSALSSVSHNVTVNQLADFAKLESFSGVSDGFDGMTGNTMDITRMKKGTEFDFTIDGVKKTITLDENYTTEAGLQTGLNALLKDAFGEVEVTVDVDGTPTKVMRSKVTAAVTGGQITFNSELSSSRLKVENSSPFVSRLGLSSGSSNTISSREIIDFTQLNDANLESFKLQIDGGDEILVKDIAASSDVSTLIQNINAALSNTEVNGTDKADQYIKAIADPENSTKIKFVALNSSADKVTLKGGDTNNLLEEIGIAHGTDVSSIEGLVDFSEDESGKGLVVKVGNGTGYDTYDIILSQNYGSDTGNVDVSQLATDIQAQLGTAPITVSMTDGKISFIPDGEQEVIIEKEDVIGKMGFTSNNNTNRISLSSSLENLYTNRALTKSTLPEDIKPYDTNGEMEITINGVTITATKEDSINTMMKKINSSDANVRIDYDSIEDQFTFKSKDMGAAAKIELQDVKGQFFSAIGVDTSVVKRGLDGKITLDGTTITRGTNSFDIDGINYDLKEADPGQTVNVSTTFKPDNLIEKIKTFVEKYNEVIDQINGNLTEKTYRDYQPLTDEQRDGLSEKEIEKWEEKAKSGLLRSDSILEAITSGMRSALNEKVQGVSLSLYDIGISTSSNYTQRGKLVINETKLKAALSEKPYEVIDLFTQTSEIDYKDTSNRGQRYQNEGLANRLNDILEDNIRVYRDSNGRKGILLEKAGIEGDLSEFNNRLNDQLENYDTRIDDLLEDLANREERYYRMFAQMEKAISQMNSQSMWLTSQLGMGGQNY